MLDTIRHFCDQLEEEIDHDGNFDSPLLSVMSFLCMDVVVWRLLVHAPIVCSTGFCGICRHSYPLCWLYEKARHYLRIL